MMEKIAKKCQNFICKDCDYVAVKKVVMINIYLTSKHKNRHDIERI